MPRRTEPPDQTVPPALDAAVEAHVMADLAPTAAQVHLKVGASALGGVVLSLTVCGQFGVGFTDVAAELNHGMHASMGPVTCALVCGALYAVFPVLLLRGLFCTALQFKALVRRRRAFVVGWLAAVGFVLASFGHHGTSPDALIAWLLAALAVSYGLARLLERLPWTLGAHQALTR